MVLNFVFSGLCEENLKPSSDGPATLSGDLQGFWDMMMLQVADLHDMNTEIQKIRENGWQVCFAKNLRQQNKSYVRSFFRKLRHQVLKHRKAAA